MSTEDEIVGVIFTFLQEKSQPCYASEICEGVPGLSKKQETVVRLLRTMCETDMVKHIRGKYILTENMTSQIEGNLSCDGPTYGITCGTNQGTDVTRTAVVPSEAEAIVPVQQTCYQRSSSSDSVCNTTDFRLHTDNLTKIIDFLKGCPGAVKAKDIAQRTAIGKSRSDVNRYLYFLKQHNIIQDNGRAEWTFTGTREVRGDDIQVYAAQLAKVPAGKSKGKQQSQGLSSSDCPCPNAGPRCQHITNNFQQNIHHHHHNIQIGEQNIMRDQPPDGTSPGGGHP